MLTVEEPPVAATDERRQDPLVAVCSLLLACLLFLPALQSRGAWHVDEARYTVVGRDMQTSGQYLVPHLNGEVYAEKPPSFFWAVAGLGRIVEDPLVASRLASGLSVLAAALALAALGRLLFQSRRTGWLAALLFLSTTLILDRGQRGFIDPFLLGFTTLATAGLLALARTSGRRLGWWTLTTVSFTLGALCKGPAVFLPPILAWVLLAGREGRSRSWRPLLVATVGSLTLCGLWLALAVQEAGREYFDHLVGERALANPGGGTPHAEPWHFYLTHLPADLLPWLLLLPATLIGLRRERGTEGARTAGLLLVCAVVLLAVFSALTGKRAGYLLGLVPFWCLACSWVVGSMERRRTGSWALGLPLFLLALLFALVGVTLLLSATQEQWLRTGVALVSGFDATWPNGVTAALAGGGVVLLVLAWGTVTCLQGRQWTSALVCAALAVGVGSAVAHRTVLPAIDPIRSLKPLVQRFEELRRGDEQLCLLKSELGGRIHLVSGQAVHRVVPFAELTSALAEPGRLWLAMRPRDHRRLSPPEQANLALVLSHAAAHLYVERARPLDP